MLTRLRRSEPGRALRLATAGLVAASLWGGTEEPTAGTNPYAGMKPGEILGRTFTTVPDDLVAMVKSPFEHPLGAVVVTGSLAALVAVDKQTTKAWQRLEPKSFSRGWFDSAEVGGGRDAAFVALIPLTYGVSLAAGSERGQVAGLLSAKALVYSVLVTQITLKSITGRRRPNDDLNSGLPAVFPQTDDPWDWGHAHAPKFRPSADATSFPSFHATMYASVAEVARQVFELPWIVPYGVAAVAFTTGGKHQHWFSDIVAGSLVGMGIGRVVVREFRAKGAAFRSGGLTGSLQPYVDAQGGGGLNLRLTW